MGNDGGTIAKRLDIINLYKKVAIESGDYDDKREEFVCLLTRKPLKDEAIVGDYKGNLFIKQLILEFLINKKYITNKSLKHIRSLGDFIDLKPVFEDSELVCPVTKAHENLLYLRTCGCILNRKLVQKLAEFNGSTCPNCNTAFEFIDIVYINANENDMKINEDNYQQLKNQGLTHTKKSKKRKHADSKDLKRKKHKIETTET